jgi:excinuclease UvrABC nuclease subunit
MPVYKDDRNTNIGFSKGKSGVYIIQNKVGDICYIGYSASDVYKTCLRHFQSWEDSKQVRVAYADKTAYRVRIILTTADRAAKLEMALIIKHRPKDNPNKLPHHLRTPVYCIQIENEYEKARVSNWDELEDAPF